MRTVILGGRLVTPLQLLDNRALIIEDGKISALIDVTHYYPWESDVHVDASGSWVTPGLIDLHTHGGDGADCMDASQDALHCMGSFFARHGVTAYLPTSITASRDAIDAAIAAVAAYEGKGDDASPLGIHLEGPYLNQQRKGAQPAAYLRNPDADEYKQWFNSGIVHLMTLAPELPDCSSLIYYGIQHGSCISIGHSEATYEQTREAIEAGIRQASHTFNAMQPLHHRLPGVVGAVLTDKRVYAQMIVDGVHLHPAIVRLLVQAKGIERLLLVTDSMRAAGLEDGIYELGGQRVHVVRGVARLADGSLAGSTLTLDRALRLVMNYGRVSFAEAIRMATYNPAEVMGWLPLKGVIQVGSDADLAMFDEDFHVKMTFAKGKIIYQRKS
jgi:N-acetylglucosamine-6-phosphate deacetylase